MELPELKPGYLVVTNFGRHCLVVPASEPYILELIDPLGDCVTSSVHGIIFGGTDIHNIKAVYGFCDANCGYGRFGTENRPLIWESEESIANKKIVTEQMIRGHFGQDCIINLEA